VIFLACVKKQRPRCVVAPPRRGLAVGPPSVSGTLADPRRCHSCL
jgi:hypothetical protein